MRKGMLNTFWIAVAVVVALVALAWLGLQVRPSPLAPYAAEEPALEWVSRPEGLPEPVERFYRQVYGDEIPVITSMVLSGRASLRINGIRMPGRFRFTHDAGQGYRHYIETTWFGLPLLKVNETYLNGEARLELPFGVTENAPKVNQGANLGLWAESMWLPALYLTDPRVRWEPIDSETALLVVPWNEDEQHFVVRFAPDTGMIHLMEAMRYREEDSPAKTLWLCDAVEWDALGGRVELTRASLTWFDEGTPWVLFDVDEIVYNIDVAEYIRSRGR